MRGIRLKRLCGDPWVYQSIHESITDCIVSAREGEIERDREKRRECERAR